MHFLRPLENGLEPLKVRTLSSLWLPLSQLGDKMNPTHAFLICGSEPKRTCMLFSGSAFAKEPKTPKPRPFPAEEVGDGARG